jgi:hypothetical protein
MKRAFLLSLLGTGLAIAASAFAPAAQAHGTTYPMTSLAGCASPALAPALSAFGDPRSYFLAPGGDFESSRHGWRFTGGAALAAGSGPLRRGTSSSLRIPAGATATSPVFCVDLDYPTFRFFHAQGASPLSVDVIYPALGAKKPKATTVKGGSTSWTLAKDVSLRPETVTKSFGWRHVQLRFVADTGAQGDWLVDDVLVDPRMRG